MLKPGERKFLEKHVSMKWGKVVKMRCAMEGQVVKW